MRAGGEGDAEDEMVGWYHRLNGHGFRWTPGIGDEQGGLACCGPWGHKQSDMSERLNLLTHKNTKPGCLIFVNDNNEGNITLKERIIMLLIFGIIFAMLYAISFTEWTPIGSSSIDGLQSRYFIPIVLLFYIALSNNLIKLNVKNKYRFYFILICIVQLLSITSIVIGFY